jgi:hypothetical protein
MASRVTWAEEHDDYIVEQYKKGVPARAIVQGLNETFDLDRSVDSLHSHMTKLRHDGRLPETAHSKKMREIMTARHAARAAGKEPAPKTEKKRTRKDAMKDREPWSEAESERMWQLIASGASPEVTAAEISKEFNTTRTAKKVTSRLNWLKAKAASGKAAKKAPKSAIVLANQDPKIQAEPVQLALPLAEERHVRIDFSRGAVALSVSGDVPDSVKDAINKMLWA